MRLDNFNPYQSGQKPPQPQGKHRSGHAHCEKPPKPGGAPTEDTDAVESDIEAMIDQLPDSVRSQYSSVLAGILNDPSIDRSASLSSLQSILQQAVDGSSASGASTESSPDPAQAYVFKGGNAQQQQMGQKPPTPHRLYLNA